MRSPMTDNDALLGALGRQSRRERRERVANALAVLRATQSAGFPLKRAVVEGVEMEFGAPAPEKAAATLTPLEAWKATRNARQA